MHLERRAAGSSVVVTPHEARIDAQVATELRQGLGALVESGHTRIALDLGEVEFVDSSGLSALVTILRSLPDQGEIVIARARPGVLSLLRLTRLDQVFRTYPGEAEALAALRS